MINTGDANLYKVGHRDAALQIFVGEYANAEPTTEGAVGSVIFGFTGLDFCKDAADTVYGIHHWSELEDPFGNLVLNGVAFLPLIGAVKNVKQLKHLDEVGEAADALHDAAKAASNSNIPRSLLDRIVDEANEVATDGGRICDTQRLALRQNLPVVQRRGPSQNQVLRDEFRRSVSWLTSEWERMTGRIWPTGATPHHIIPLESGGANAWWNLMPTRGSLPNHSLPGVPGPHASGSVLRSTIQQGPKALPKGRVTDLRRPG